MAKVRTSYVCRDCGNVQPKWMGKCPDCGAWDALDRFVDRSAVEAAPPGRSTSVRRRAARVRRAPPSHAARWRWPR